MSVVMIKKFLKETFEKSKYDFAGVSPHVNGEPEAFDVLTNKMLAFMIESVSPNEKEDIFHFVLDFFVSPQKKPQDLLEKKVFFDQILLKVASKHSFSDTTLAQRCLDMDFFGTASLFTYSPDQVKSGLEKIAAVVGKSKVGYFSSDRYIKPYWGTIEKKHTGLFLEKSIRSSLPDLTIAVFVGTKFTDTWKDVLRGISLDDAFFILENKTEVIRHQELFLKGMIEKINEQTDEKNREAFLKRFTELCFDQKIHCGGVFTHHPLIMPKDHPEYPGWHLNQIAFFENIRKKPGNKSYYKSDGDNRGIYYYLSLCGNGKPSSLSGIVGHKDALFSEIKRRFDINATHLHDLSNSFKNPLWSVFDQDQQNSLFELLATRISSEKASPRERGALSLYFYRMKNIPDEHLTFIADILKKVPLPNAMPLVDKVIEGVRSGRLNETEENINAIIQKQKLGAKAALELTTAKAMAQNKPVKSKPKL